MTVKFCSECGRELAKKAKFCDGCGIPLPPTPNPQGTKENPWREVIAIFVTAGYFATLGIVALKTGSVEAVRMLALELISLPLGVNAFYFGGKASEFTPEELKALGKR